MNGITFRPSTVEAKTARTMTREALRRIAAEPEQYALSAHAARVLAAIEQTTRQVHRNYPGQIITAQRFVDICNVRPAVDLPFNTFTRAVQELAGVYRVWLRVPAASTTEDQDRGSVLRNGTDYHQVSADAWNISSNPIAA